MDTDGEMTAADEQFETAVRMLRQGFRQKVAEKQGEIARLQALLAERTDALAQQQRRAEQLEQELARANQALKRVSVDVSKLSAFKQAIISVFDESELSAEASRRVEGRYGTPGGTPAAQGGSPAPPAATLSPVKRRGDDYTGDYSDFLDGVSSGGHPSHGAGGAAGASSTPRNQFLSVHKRPASPTLSTASSAGESKEFFRTVKARLAAEDFEDFIHNIKALNAGTQSKDTTLARVRSIFGERNGDLIDGLERLLSRRHA